MLLRQKAAEELKKEEERQRAERKKAITERCGEEKNMENIPIEGMRAIVQEYYDHIMAVEGGKYVKPKLKKVAKFEDKFAALNKKASEFKLKA